MKVTDDQLKQYLVKTNNFDYVADETCRLLKINPSNLNKDLHRNIMLSLTKETIEKRERELGSPSLLEKASALIISSGLLLEKTGSTTKFNWLIAYSLGQAAEFILHTALEHNTGHDISTHDIPTLLNFLNSTSLPILKIKEIETELTRWNKSSRYNPRFFVSSLDLFIGYTYVKDLYNYVLEKVNGR